jgi:hypothetical protein
VKKDKTKMTDLILEHQAKKKPVEVKKTFAEKKPAPLNIYVGHKKKGRA